MFFIEMDEMYMEKYQNIYSLTSSQEELLKFSHFTNEDGKKIGEFVSQYCKDKGKVVAVAVRKVNGAILYHFLPEDTNLGTQIWMKRKFNTVARCEKSSLGVWADFMMKKETLKDHAMPETDFALCGGGFPIRLSSGEFVGVITASNLMHIEDHQVVVDALAEYLGRSDVPKIQID